MLLASNTAGGIKRVAIGGIGVNNYNLNLGGVGSYNPFPSPGVHEGVTLPPFGYDGYQAGPPEEFQQPWDFSSLLGNFGGSVPPLQDAVPIGEAEATPIGDAVPVGGAGKAKKGKKGKKGGKGKKKGPKNKAKKKNKVEANGGAQGSKDKKDKKGKD